ncbi:hypothetical protein evm_001899 [Chilo suppressalis]|nr:hypothetical protein evm_001899 [Chilo suppressalis]
METILKKPEDQQRTKPPNYMDFDLFLPWAYRQLQVDENMLTVKKIIQTDYVSVAGHPDRHKPKAKSKTFKIEHILGTQQDDQDVFQNPHALKHACDIHITAVYDTADHLVQLIFQNNREIPRLIFKIINLMIHYYNFLNTITINKGLQGYSLYEISKFLPLSHITDICLDNTFIEEGNYYLLLENKCMLRHLSLRRCSINDEAVEKLANNLIYPNNGSKSLSILNLATNKITDEGAKYLAEALRTNRQLSYLNLADNRITDIGATYLFDSLLEFPLTCSEIFASRSRKMTYLKEKNEHIARIVKTLRTNDFEKRVAKRKTIKPPVSAKMRERENSLKFVPTSKSLVDLNKIMYDKAADMAENLLGIFFDPFDKENTREEDGIMYCNGNNTLCNLNLAYNNLSYIILKKLLTVLKYQREMGRTPKGLISVTIEGNYMPVSCRELEQIDNMIQVGVMTLRNRFSAAKKRSPAKVGVNMK